MLSGFLAKNRISLHFSGSISELQLLQDTISKLILLIHENNLEETAVYLLLVDFSEKIKNAYLRKDILFELPEYALYTFKNSFTNTINVLNLLISLSEYIVIDELDEVNILLLTYLLKKAANNYNTQDSICIKSLIAQKFNVNTIKSFITRFNGIEQITPNSLK